jgi:hypothetical protein
MMGEQTITTLKQSREAWAEEWSAGAVAREASIVRQLKAGTLQCATHACRTYICNYCGQEIKP